MKKFFRLSPSTKQTPNAKKDPAPVDPPKAPKLNVKTDVSSILSSVAGLSLAPSKIVVGLDLGTTFTGFMFCQRRDPDNIYGEYNWEGQTEVLGRPYCKTSTSSLYEKTCLGGARLLKYGYPAIVENLDFLGAHPGPEAVDSRALLSKIKLQLAGAEYVNNGGVLQLPWGLTVNKVLSDFVAEIKKKALRQIQVQLGDHIRETHIQWCLTVPAIWDSPAKEEMKRIAENAGLIGRGGSQHQLHIVLEPEAAALYCDHHMKSSGGGNQEGLQVGDVFLVADVGGGTTDLIVLEKGDHKFREVVAGSGDLCGGTDVDAAFADFLRKRIGPCFDKYQEEDPCQALMFTSWWEQKKRSFTGAGYAARFDLPVRLSNLWKEQDKIQIPKVPVGAMRDRINIGVDEVCAIFDPTVDRILNLIREQLKKSPTCKYLFVVGGFAESPYLAERIKKAFARRVKVVTPPVPGAAICQGAVLYGLNPAVISERTARKTYGIQSERPFREGDPEGAKWFNKVEGCFYVHNSFSIFVRAGDQVAVASDITHTFCPLTEDQRSIEINLLSTEEHDPKWAADPGVVKSSCFSVNIAPVVPFEKRSVEVRMRFGGTSVEVTAYGPCVVNGENLKAIAPFESRFGAKLC